MHGLVTANESQALLVDEQRAEIGLLKAKLSRVEGKTEALGGARVSMVGDAVAPTSLGWERCLGMLPHKREQEEARPRLLTSW